MLSSNPICPVCNYATSAVYCDLPTPEQLVNGVKPLDSLPAAWWNKMWNMINCSVNQARGAVGSFITELNNVLAGAGICPNCVCTDQLYQAIDLIRQTIGNATVAGAVKSSSTPGMVSIDNNGFMTANCVGNATQLATSARTLVGAVNELKTTYDTCFGSVSTALGGKAPTSHASSTNTYGVGTAAAYGHLRISGTYTSDLSDTGVAASQTALYCVYKYAEQIASSATGLGNTVGCPLGTASAGTAATAARSDHVHPSCSSTTLVLDVSNPSCWNEGLRINTACNGWTTLLIGGLAGSCLGCTGAFSFHTYCVCCPEKLFVAYQGSMASSYFEPIGDADGTVRWHGNVCGNVCGLATCAVNAIYADQADRAVNATYADCACALCNRPTDTQECQGVCNLYFYSGCTWGCNHGMCCFTSCICGCNGYYYGNVCGTASCAIAAGLCCSDDCVQVYTRVPNTGSNEALVSIYVENFHHVPVIITNPMWSCCGYRRCIYSPPEACGCTSSLAMGNALIQVDRDSTGTSTRCLIGSYMVCLYNNPGGACSRSWSIPYRMLGYANE